MEGDGYQLEGEYWYEKRGPETGGAGGALSTAHHFLIFSDSFIYLTLMFVYMQFFCLFLITSLITTTVFRSHCFADCRLSKVCVYLRSSIYF